MTKFCKCQRRSYELFRPNEFDGVFHCGRCGYPLSTRRQINVKIRLGRGPWIYSQILEGDSKVTYTLVDENHHPVSITTETDAEGYPVFPEQFAATVAAAQRAMRAMRSTKKPKIKLDKVTFRVGKLIVRPGDFLVLKTGLLLDRNQVTALRKVADDQFKGLGVRIAVLTGDMSLAVLRKEKK